MHTQLPYTGSTLACGRIDLTRFLMIVDRTMLCDPKVFDEIDADLAVEIAIASRCRSSAFAPWWIWS